MSRFLKFIPPLFFVVLLALPACRSTAAGEAQGSNAVAALDFSLPALDGRTVKLSDLKGRPVLINFWASWCPGCREEMPLLQAIHEERQGNGLEILAVDIGESPDTVKQFLQDNKLTFTALLDQDTRVSMLYGIRLIPTSVLVDKNGDIRDIKVGAFADKAEIRRAVDKIMP